MNIADVGLTCNYCWHLVKPGDRYVSFRIPGQKDSGSPMEYEHYHNRLRNDCYGKKRKELASEAEMIHSLPLEKVVSGVPEEIGLESRRGQP